MRRLVSCLALLALCAAPAARAQKPESVHTLYRRALGAYYVTKDYEAFRRLSWDAIGPNAILSRAAAGVVRGLVVIALPGSPKAVELAVAQLIGPVLAHAVALASGKGGHHHRQPQDKEQRG